MAAPIHFAVSPRTCQFPRKEREVLGLMRDGLLTKEIAGILEISYWTVLRRKLNSCKRACVVDETELRLFLLQHPGILVKGAKCAPGLHIPVMRDGADDFPDKLGDPCQCGDLKCPGWVAMRLKMA